MIADVAIAPCNEYSETEARKALLEVMKPFGFPEAIKPGQTVIIKANLVSFLKPERAATTHPVLLSELVRIITERGAKAIIGDSPGGIYTPMYLNKVYRATGMTEVQKAGAELNQDVSILDAEFNEAVKAHNFSYTAYLNKADMIINFCKLKSHGMMGMSAAVKNMFGCIPGTTKPEFHYRFPNYSDFANMLIDLNEYFKPSLNLVDAVVGMEGNGPTSGTPRPIGALLAGKNQYAVDLLCADIIGLKPDDVPTICESIKRGLCPKEPSLLKIYGDAKPFYISDYKNIAQPSRLKFAEDQKGFISQLFSATAETALSSRPKLKASECVGCNECGRLCPANAIKIVGGKARINRKECIRCFCCQEFCPKGALKSHRPLIARILSKL